MSDRGRDKDGELKSEQALSSKSGCYKEQDSGQVVLFEVDQGLTHDADDADGLLRSSPKALILAKT